MPLKSGKNTISENIKELTGAGHSQEQAVAIAMKKAYDDSQDAPEYFGKKINENMIETPEGFLICLNVTIATTEPMEYANSEIGLDTDKAIVLISSPVEELLSPSTIASFNGKPVTLLHPEGPLLTEVNAAVASKGVVLNVRAANQSLVADLIIICAEAILAIKGGIRDVSCGYDTVAVVDNGDGTGFRKGIIGNHVAIVPEGRCGAQCAIKDSKGTQMEDEKISLSVLAKMKSFFADAKTKDEDTETFDAKKAYDGLAKEFQDFKDAFGKDFSDFKDSFKAKDAKDAKDEDGDDDDDDEFIDKAKDAKSIKDGNSGKDAATPRIAIRQSFADAFTPNITAQAQQEAFDKFYKKGN